VAFGDKRSNIPELRQNNTNVTDDQQEILRALSIGAKINDLGWPWRSLCTLIQSKCTMV